MALKGDAWWLASRYAGIASGRARTVIALFAALLMASLFALAVPDPRPSVPTVASSTAGQTDLMLYDEIVAGVRAGGDYYEVAADSLRGGGYPLRPFVTFRLPTLAVVQATLPSLVTLGILYALAAGVMLAWWSRLHRAFRRPLPAVAGIVMLAGGMVAFVQSDLILFHEIWAGLLIALSLARFDRDRWIEAVALGLAAMLVRELAVVYAASMLALAALDGRRREAVGWLVAIAIFAVVVVAHAFAVAAVVQDGDPASQGWSGLLGFGHYIRAVTLSSALMILPLWLAAPIVSLALFGWTCWRDPLAVRVAATFAAFALLLGLFGRADTFYWGLMVAPTLLIGLIFLPDGLRDLVQAARGDRRSITVTRVAR